jgi:hypothetical protein
MREEKGPGRKINGLFHWISEDSLVLHEVAKSAGLEGNGPRRKVSTLCMKNVESTCAYWVPLTDWKGETKYLEARGVDYIAQLPGNEEPRKWYDRFPGLAEARDIEAEEKAPIEMMIARDNWKWMTVRQASRITGRQDKEKTRNKRLLAKTQFGKRLLLLPCVEASEVIPPKEDEEEWYVEKGVSKEPTASTRMLDQEEKEDAQWIERRAQEFCGHVEVHPRRAENRRRSGAWRSRPREQVSRKLARARSTLVCMIAMLTASLVGLAGVEGFQAYDCSNSSNPVDMYSLLDLEPCPDVAMDHVVERMLHGEIVQMKRERLIRITRCHVVEFIMSQYCGWQSRAGIVRSLKFREPITVEPSACRHANKTGMIVINKKSWTVQMGAIRSYSDFLEGSLDLGHNCQVGTHTHGGVVLDLQTTQSVLEVLGRMEWARVNEVSGMITTTSGLITPVTDRSMMDTQDGTCVWEYSQEDCPDSIVQLYLGSIKVLSNSSTSYMGGLAIMEGSEKDQVAGLELTESFLLCGRAAMCTHIKNIVIFFHPMSGIQVASGKFSTATGEAEVTRLESEVSFLQVKATMSLKERIRQVKAEICDNRRQIAHVRLESLAGAENPYILMQVFGRGHQITKNGATVYVTKCQAVEVVPRQHTECTNEIPVTFNETEVFVDPISLVIKTAAAPVRCNDIAPPRWKLGGKMVLQFSCLEGLRRAIQTARGPGQGQ